MSPWKVILATMVIFGCGVVTGGLFVRNDHVADLTDRQADHPAVETLIHTNTSATSGAHHPSAPPLLLQRTEFLRKMDKQLHLTPDQHERIEKIMRASTERSKPIWEQIAPQMRQELQRVTEEMRASLTPEQQQKFADLLHPHGKKNDAANRSLSRTATNISPTTN